MNKHPAVNAPHPRHSAHPRHSDHPRHSSACRNPVTEYLNIWTTAQAQKPTGRGKRTNNQSIYGIKKLRELILELAVRGKLVEQNFSDEPANILLARIATEKEQLISDGKIKKTKTFPEVQDDEKLFEVPEGWEWIRIRDAGHDWGQKKPSNEFTYIDVSAIDNRLGHIKLPAVLAARDAPSRARKIVTTGTVIYSTIRPYLQNICVVDTDYYPEPIASTAFAILHPYVNMPGKYFTIYFKSPVFIRYVECVQTGIAYPAINDKQFFGALVPLPPLAEQHRIVAKVDELMTLCDQLEQQQTNSNATHQTLVETLLATLTHPTTGTDGSEINAIEIFFQHFDTLFTTEHSIDQLKQTILQLAVIGKLVPQDPDDEPASILLERIVEEKARLINAGKIRKQKPLPDISKNKLLFELPRQWEIVTFGRLMNLVSGQHLKSEEYAEKQGNGMISYLTGPAEFGENFPNPTRFTLERRAVAHKGDILITCKGSGVGKLNLVQKDTAISRQLMAIQPIVLPTKYCKLLAESLKETLRENIVGIAIPGISREDVTGVAVRIPPLAEQHRIVAKMDELMALCEALKVQIGDTRSTQLQLADTIVYQAVI